MGIELPETAPGKLIDYLGLLVHWNRAFNLTAIRNSDEMLSKHLLDSLGVLPYIGAGLILDVGSGAGRPTAYPCAKSTPSSRNLFRTCSVSTHSAVVWMPMMWATWLMAATMARSPGSSMR